jgi:FkbM family methyltransferase
VAGPVFRLGWAFLRHRFFVPKSPIVVNGFYMVIGPPPYFPGLELAYGVYEPGTTKLFELMLRPGMTVVDVGAHVGYYTLLAARLVGDQGRVYAFEPHPDTFKVLCQNVKINRLSNVVAIPKAVDDTIGRKRLFLAHGSSGLHSLYARGLVSPYSIWVDTTTLDAFFAEEGWPPIDLIKMDIEGGEPAALRGMAQLLTRCPTLKLIVEYSPERLKAAGVQPEAFLRQLNTLGFRLFVVMDDGGLVPADHGVAVQGREYVNLFCEK